MVEVDLTGLDIGGSIHISAVKLPEGATPTIRERDFTLVTIGAPSGMKADAEAAPAAAAPAAGAAAAAPAKGAAAAAPAKGGAAAPAKAAAPAPKKK
jgi:large subunit ribosomal protein L25